MSKRTIVTSALIYGNGSLHIGHIAGAYLPADIYTRYKKLKGDDCIFICGSDEHGVPITFQADKEGVSPKEIIDRYYNEFIDNFPKLGINFDNFSRTSLSIHHKNAQDFFLKLYNKGLVFKKEIEQLYCPHCKKFLPDRYVYGTCPYCKEEGARGDQCEKCGRWLEPPELIDPHCSVCDSSPEVRKTTHFYFKLSSFENQLKEWLESKKNWKDNVKTLALSWIREGLRDRAITRDLTWGVPVPLKEAQGKVLYVWFDAPIGYISSTMEWAEKIGKGDEWKRYWMDEGTEIVHFIGKDNIIFHAIVWPAMLMAYGEYNLPTQIPANEFLNLSGEKLSTSRRWAVWIPDLLKGFEPDFIRYGISSIMPETKDSSFDFYDFQRRVNTELVDNFGNFVNRTLQFIKKYIGDEVSPPRNHKGIDLQMMDIIKELPHKVGEPLESFQFRKALRELMSASSFGNRYFDYKRPWETRRKDPQETERTLFLCASLLKALAVIGEPFLPFSSEKIRKMLNVPSANFYEVSEKSLNEPIKLHKIDILYKKIEDSQIKREIELLEGRPIEEKIKEKSVININDFEKLEIKIGKIEKVEEVSGSDKLYTLLLDIGDKKVQVVAGIKENYKKEELIGVSVPVLLNLEPRKIYGILSEGMILACVDRNRVVLLSPVDDVPPGTRIS